MYLAALHNKTLILQHFGSRVFSCISKRDQMGEAKLNLLNGNMSISENKIWKRLISSIKTMLHNVNFFHISSEKPFTFPLPSPSLLSAVWNINNRMTGCVPVGRFFPSPRCWAVYIAALCEFNHRSRVKRGLVTERGCQQREGTFRLSEEVPGVDCCRRRASEQAIKLEKCLCLL